MAGLPRPGRNLSSVDVEQRPPALPWTRPDVLIGAGVAVALAIAFIVWLLVRGGGGDQPKYPRAASQEEMRALAVQVGHPIYWVGSRSDEDYELTRTASGRISASTR